jgi:hypothetical protein
MTIIKEYLKNSTKSFNEFIMKIFNAIPDWKELMESKPLEFTTMLNSLEAFHAETIEAIHAKYIPVQPLFGGTTSFIYCHSGKVVICQTIEDFRMVHDVTNEEEIISKMKELESKPYETLSTILFNFLTLDYLEFSGAEAFSNINNVKNYLEEEFNKLSSEAYISFDLEL